MTLHSLILHLFLDHLFFLWWELTLLLQQHHTPEELHRHSADQRPPDGTQKLAEILLLQKGLSAHSFLPGAG